MKRLLALLVVGMFATAANADIIATDPGGDVGISILDLVQLEANSDGTDLVLTVTINGDVGATDWGKYLLFIDTDGVNSSGGASQFPDADPPTNDANPWVRNVAIGNLDHLAEYFIGSWVDWGGGAQLWEFTGVGSPQWGQLADPATVIAAGATSTVEYTMPLASLGVGVGDTIYLEAFSSGGGSFDTANDTVNNPADDWVWDQVDWGAQASVQNSSAYTIVPEPATLTLLGIGGLVLLRRRR